MLTAVVGILCIIFVAGIGFLIVEYRFFKNQAEKVSALQTEYKNYVLSVRKLLRGSSLVKDSDQQTAAAVVEKKNSEEPANLLVVNRNPDHVKVSSLAFFKRQRMEHLFKRIATTEWVEYTEQALAAQEAAKKPAHKITKVRPVKRNRGLLRRFAMHAKKPVSAAMLADKSSKIFSWPIEPSRFWLSSLFGPRKNPRGWKFHQGIDMAAIKGTPVKAVAPGEVVEARLDAGYGKTILLSHSNHYQTRYAHLDKILVAVGQYVERGTVIGRVGATGNVRSMGFDGSHLHFEVHSGGRRVNPLHLLG
jgi:murein DD-endopeptidase MepM/ murein hydrolase activator NlpD